MAAYELTGKVKLVMDVQEFDSGFKKREFVVTTEDDRYPQDISFETLAERINLLDNIQPGQEVTVTFDIRGREYNGRYFNNLNAWKISASAAVEPVASDDECPPMREDFSKDQDAENTPPF